MKEITYFYLKSCPFCKAADKYLSEIIKEEPRFSEIRINKIEETENPQIADSYDYYFVPCMWIDGKKIHEGAATKAAIKNVLEKAAV